MKIKVVSLNLWDGGRLFDEAIAFLVQEDPDILLLQEVYNSNDSKLERRFRSFEILSDTLSLPYKSFAAEFLDNREEGKIPQGNAVFSKFPIKAESTTFFDRPFDENYVEVPENFPTISRNLQHITLGTSLGDVNVFNFHGVWDLNGDNFSEARKNMAEVILEVTQRKQRIILAGDTNAKPSNLAMEGIAKQLKSVFGQDYPTTFNMKRKDNPGYATAAVDMMFVSSDIQVLSKDVPPVDVSDHLPLIAGLELG